MENSFKGIQGLTPEEYYIKLSIEALDNFIENPNDDEMYGSLLTAILERPKTLRAALKSYMDNSIAGVFPRYCALKREEAENLNKVLSKLPQKEFEFRKHDDVTIYARYDEGFEEAFVVKVKYPITYAKGIFIISNSAIGNGSELVEEVGYGLVNFGCIEEIQDNIG